MRNERKDNMSKTDKDITPQGYLYGSDPKAFHPFWEDEGGTGDVPDITVTASVDANTGTPEVTVNQTGDHGENIDLAFKNLKGEKGDKGETGSQGPMGPQGPKGDDGTSVDPSYIVKEVVIGSIEDLSMGTKELSFSYVTNDSESHSLDTMHIADKQLVLENVQTSEDSAKTSKIGEINLYTIDQEGTPGSQSIGVAAITNADKSISLCPAINKTGTWEYGPAFATIPATDLTGYISNLEIQYKQNTPKDGVEAYDLKWSINGNSLGGGTRIVVPDYTETVKDITAETSTTDSGTTVTLYQQKFGTEKTKVTDINIPKAGGSITLPEYLLNGGGYSFDAYCKYSYGTTDQIELTLSIPLFAPNGSIVPYQTGSAYFFPEGDSNGTELNYVIEGQVTNTNTGFAKLTFQIPKSRNQDTDLSTFANKFVHCNGNSIIQIKSYTQAEADEVNAQIKYDKEHNLIDVDGDNTDEGE